MASFLLPSSIQKRLLRYALSRLDFLDSDVLDLEHLDIKWGTKSVLEFRDVPLRLKKLAGLLQLPPSFDLTKARILLLRITVPVDVYSSSIVVEVDGVEAQLVALSEEGRSSGVPSKSRTNHERKGDRSGGGKRKSSRHVEHEAETILPSAYDLAASFVQTEPANEKAELEAAIASQSQHLSASMSVSDDGEDEPDLGTGAGLALPTFMANFLKGIVDRLQLKIRGIVFNLDISLPSETISLSTSPLPRDVITIQVSVEDVDIEGVTLGTSEPVLGAVADEVPRKEGKRLISLKNLRGTLISDATLFASLARSSALNSPSTTHSDLSEARSKLGPSIPRSTIRAQHESKSDTSENLDKSRLSYLNQPGPAGPSNYAVSATSQLFDSFAGRDASADEDHTNSPIDMSSHDLRESMLDSSRYFDQVTDSQVLCSNDGEQDPLASHGFYSSARPSHSTSPISTPRASLLITPTEDTPHEYVFGHSDEFSSIPPRTQPLQSTILPERSRKRYSSHRVSQSQPLPDPQNSLIEPETIVDPMVLPESTEIPTESPSFYSSSSVSTPDGQEDLTKSMMFSHEEAESMYMSAISTREETAGMPGAWDDSSHEEANTTNDNEDDYFHDIPRQASHDNLEHALQVSVEETDLQDSGSIPITQSSTTSSSASPTSLLNSTLTDRSQIMGKAAETYASQHPSQEAASDSSVSLDGPGRVSKQLFNIDQAAIYLGSTLDSVAADLPANSEQSTMFASTYDWNDRLAQSMAPNIPGAFSMRRDRAKPTETSPADLLSTPTMRIQPSDSTAQTEIDVGHIDIQFDVSAGRIIARLTQCLLQLMETGNSPSPKSGSAEKTAVPLSLQVHTREITLKFLDRLKETIVLQSQKAAVESWKTATSSDVLLQTTLRGLDISISKTNTITHTNIALQNFTFGYAEENIVAFNAGLRLRQSAVEDLVPPQGFDFSLNVTQSPETTRIKIATLPVHVAIDLQRLDETFSWFGGLSGVLNMGSSMASSVASPVKSAAKPRGVRFDAPIKTDDKSIESQNKIDLRAGGFVLDLIGKHCMVSIESTAVKLIKREEGLGMTIGLVKVSGPHIHGSNDPPAIIANVRDTRLEFLDTPKDADLTRLLGLITPSKVKYDDDDDILLDTLLRQRRQGSVLRLTMERFDSHISNIEQLKLLPALGEEISRLSTMAKYLPEDDRPGLLSLVLIGNANVLVDVNNVLGTFRLKAKDIEMAQITLPSLVATSVASFTLHRNEMEEIVGAGTPVELRDGGSRLPAIMARMIGDEMDPKIKLMFWNIRIEYRVPLLLVLMDFLGNTTTEEMVASMATSVATLTDHARFAIPRPPRRLSDGKSSEANPMKIDISLRDCMLGLNPMGLPSKVLIVFTESHVAAALPKNNETSVTAELSKGSILVIDDTSNLISSDAVPKLSKRLSIDGGSNQVKDLCAMGFVSVSYISSARAIVNIYGSDDDTGKSVEVELRDDLFVLESCADSTQTLITALNGLKPPTLPSTEIKYRTKVIPVEDLLASLSGDAFGTAEGVYDFDDDFPDAKSALGDHQEDEDNFDLNINSEYLHERDLDDSFEDQYHDDSREGSLMFDQDQVISKDTNDGVLLESYSENKVVQEEIEELNFKEDHFGTGSVIEGTAHRWNSAKNAYDKTDTVKIKRSPLKVCVRDVHIIWNLFDGYDWQNTRNAITKAVQDVESKAIEKKNRHDNRPTFEQDLDDEETVIGDFLFNSIYIGIPSSRDPGALAMAINQELNDNATETESIAPTMVSGTTSYKASQPLRVKGKRLRLHRSRHHKITFELKGVNVDLVAFPPGSGETESSIDVRIHDLDVFDHVPTSTWKKFATYMHDAGERESGSSQVHLELLNVKPQPDLAASEIVLRVTILPLRLHVDQDALDFITRFFEFKDDNAPISTTPSEPPFLQRVEVNAIQVKLDFKPKRVDYAGLRSGRTTEFMNFIVLDEADMVMRHCILYGVSGFDKMGKCLNDIWMPDIKRNQLPGILAGLAPVRSLANVGGGMVDLIRVPIEEYKKDGRVVRSLRKGATAFTKTTGIELVRLGAKLGYGTQAVLEKAEQLLTEGTPSQLLDDEDLEEEERKHISLYANQPIGVAQGLRGGYAGLTRDLVLARDAIIAIPGAIMDSGNAVGAAAAVGSRFPTVVLRPAIGIAKAIGHAGTGIVNQMDPNNHRKAQEKYKSY